MDYLCVTWRIGEEGRTVQVALAVEGEAPAGVLGEGVEHVVEEANSRVHGNLLGLGGLGGVGVLALEETGVGVRGKVTAVEVEGELDLRLVGVAGEGGRAHGGRGAHGGFREGKEGE